MTSYFSVNSYAGHLYELASDVTGAALANASGSISSSLTVLSHGATKVIARTVEVGSKTLKATAELTYALGKANVLLAKEVSVALGKGAVRAAARSVRPFFYDLVIKKLPAISMENRNAVIDTILNPASSARTFIEKVIEQVLYFVKNYLLRKDIEYLVDNGFERLLAKGRIKSAVFNTMTRFNLHRNFIQERRGIPSDYEIDVVLEKSKSVLLESRYWNDGISSLGQCLIGFVVEQQFSRASFDQYKEMLMEQFGEFLEMEPEIKEAFMQRMTLEIMESLVQELSAPRLEEDDEVIDRGLKEEVRKFVKFVQTYLKDDEAFQIELAEFRLQEAEAEIDDIEPEAEVERDPQVDYEAIAEGQRFLGDQSGFVARFLDWMGVNEQALEERVDRLHRREREIPFIEEEAIGDGLPDVLIEEEPRDAGIGYEELRSNIDTLSRALNWALKSENTIDALLDLDFLDPATFLERYRARLSESFYSLDHELPDLHVDENTGEIYREKISHPFEYEFGHLGNENDGYVRPKILRV